MIRTVAIAVLTILAAETALSVERPNVVLIITDDAGWADFGFIRDADPAANPGARGVIPTPNLDRLASRGVSFTNAYAGSVCSVSRAMITTGRYGNRFGYGNNIISDTSAIGSSPTDQGLPTSEVTIWERMQSVGYSTAAIGKWHIGQHANAGSILGNRPENQGVELFEGLWEGSRSYSVGAEADARALRRTVSDGAGGVAQSALIEGDYSGQYITDVLGDLSVDYVRANAASTTDPFFLYTSFTAPHTPMQATPADLQYIDSLGIAGFTGSRRTYAAMQHAMDRNIGKLLDAIEDPNGDGDTSDSVAENTLLMFINDNGGDCCDVDPNFSSNGALRNGKGSQFDGGIRVPMIVAGAGVQASVRGTSSQDLVHAIDLLPTAFVGAGGGAFDDAEVIDGKNLLPYLNGQSPGVAHDNLFLPRFSNQQSAVRKGDWKYMYQPNTGYQLYNLAVNPGESNNVVSSATNATLVAELHQLLASYHVQMDKPRYDNQAPSTNQFDSFLFREADFASANFSSAGVWQNADNPAGGNTATFTDGYANNRLTFRAKSSGDYTVTNDLNSVGGFAYMANRLTLASSEAPLGAEHTATINGKGLLMVTSLDSVTPEIRLEATDANPNRFTFQIDHEIELYDDLAITGDGNQRFVFGGDIREFRPGRNLIKQGSAEATFGGEVAITGVLDLQQGKVAFTDGAVRGDVLVRAGASIRVGEEGISPSTGGGDPPLRFVQAGLELDYNAANDTSGDAIWFDSAGTADNITFNQPTSTSPVSTPTFPALSAAYSIPLSGGAAGLTNYFENTGPRSRLDATFELVFHVTDAAAGPDQVLFEAGGATRGVALVLNNNALTFNVDGDAADADLTATLTPGWNQAIGVVDLENGGDTISLYLNGALVGSLANQTIDDWAGGNPLGVGAGASSSTGVASAVGNPFHGDIAIARYYTDVAFRLDEVDQNYQWLLQGHQQPSGADAVTLAIVGDLSLESAATIELDLLNPETHDRVSAAGKVELDGVLVVSAASGFAPSAGDVYAIINGATLSGVFQSEQLPALTSGLMWQVKYDGSSATLLVTLSGDYNGDGAVDAADYTTWRDMDGQAVPAGTRADGNGDGMVNQLDYAVWSANYGQAFASGADSNATPEPTGASLTIVGGLLLNWLKGDGR
ncbi:sulfatase-like hydrolase/transferase [Botrimarina mediterranea]|uniref:sulfatase-like hydrolase/transferase n=1 Tax=Botrimarina mediterranea TaxID=2528022 RepID=UPI0018D2AB93|nr:sulfatase-like hydrolase/transferase [Botrimarina mediterranea]